MTNLCLKQMLSFAFLTDFKQKVCHFATYEPSHIQLLKPEIFTKSLYVYDLFITSPLAVPPNTTNDYPFVHSSKFIPSR